MTAEITIYFISFLIIVGMGLIVYTMRRTQENFERRFQFLRNQLNMLMIRSGLDSKKRTLDGEIDLVHPRSGEKLKAKAKFKIE